MSVRVGGAPGGSLELRISNPLADLAVPDRTGSGFGLLGVAERVASVGGTVTHGVAGDRFTLAASLPWPAEAWKGEA